MGSCNTCNLICSSLKLENGVKKHVRNVAKMKHGFVLLFFLLWIQELNLIQWINFRILHLNEGKDSELRILISNLFHEKMEEGGNIFWKYYFFVLSILMFECTLVAQFRNF